MSRAVWREVPALQEARDAYLDAFIAGTTAFGKPMAVEAQARGMADAQAQSLLAQADRLTGEISAERERRAKVAASSDVPLVEQAAALGWLNGYATAQEGYYTAHRTAPWRRIFDLAVRKQQTATG